MSQSPVLAPLATPEPAQPAEPITKEQRLAEQQRLNDLHDVWRRNNKALGPFSVQVSLGREWSLELATMEFHQHHSAQDIHWMECARRVAWGHENLSPKEFKAWVRDDLGVGRSTGYRYAAAGRAIFAHPGAMKKIAARGGMTFAMDLAQSFTVEEIDAFARGEEIEGVGDLEESADLSRRELLRRLKDAKRKTEQVEKKLEKAEAAKKKLQEEKDQLTSKVLVLEQGGNVEDWMRRAGEAERAVAEGLNLMFRLVEDVNVAGAPEGLKAAVGGFGDMLFHEADRYARLTAGVVEANGINVLCPSNERVRLSHSASLIYHTMMSLAQGERLPFGDEDNDFVEGVMRGDRRAYDVAVASLVKHGLLLQRGGDFVCNHHWMVERAEEVQRREAAIKAAREVEGEGEEDDFDFLDEDTGEGSGESGMTNVVPISGACGE